MAKAPGGPTEEPMFDLLQAMERLCWSCYKNSTDALAEKTIARLPGLLSELIRYISTGVLEEMRKHPADPQVQSMGVHMLRQMIQGSKAARPILSDSGGVQVFVEAMRHHPTDEALLSWSLQAIDELRGLPSLLQALDSLRESPTGTRAALWAFFKAAKTRWSEVAQIDATSIVRILLSAMDAYKDDVTVLYTGLETMADLLMELPENRGAFAALGGWQWLMRVMDSNIEHSKVQLHGCKLLSSLSRGGSWAEAWCEQAMAVVERALVRHDSDECVLYWALWSAQQLNGARALVTPMRQGALKTPSAVVAALKSLAVVSFGQSDGSSPSDIPGVIEAVVHAMNMYSDRYDVICEAATVLGSSAAFALGCDAGSEELRVKLRQSAELAISALLQILNGRVADAYSVLCTCEALVNIARECPEGSPARRLLQARLLGGAGAGAHGGSSSSTAPGAGGAPGPAGIGSNACAGGAQSDEPLLSRISAVHVSNQNLQFTVVWLNGLVGGVAPVLQRMAQHGNSYAVQLPGIRTIGAMYLDRIELEPGDAKCLPDAVRSVISAMSRFPENHSLQTHACFALASMAEHFLDVQVGDEVLMRCVASGAEALKLVRGRLDCRNDSSSYHAMYLRREATRSIVALCACQPALGKWLREQGWQEAITEALTSTADGIWEGRRDAETEDLLHHELLALSHVVGPQTAIPEALQRWGAQKPAVARAAADAVVDLVRRSSGRRPICQDMLDPALAGVSAPVQVLTAVGCGAALESAMQAHPADEDLQGRINLALGFLQQGGAAAAACTQAGIAAPCAIGAPAG